MLALVTTVKLLAEIALLALGQGVMGLLSGQVCERNPFYRVFQLIARPWVKAARWISPPVVLDRHLPLVAFAVLLLIWGTAAMAKVSICRQIGVALCK
jgi:hypothetical protein